MAGFVLDAWAILAWLKGEQPAAERVRMLLHASDRRERKPVMNIVNLGEVFYLCAKATDPAYGERVLNNLRHSISTASAEDEVVMLAATLKSRYAISYADGFAAATAIRREGALVTGDHELRLVAAAEGFSLEWIGN